MFELTETSIAHSICKLKREDIALVFLASLPAGFFTRTRLQSGLFLISKNLPELFLTSYEFKPESYGPRDSDIDDDMIFLAKQGNVRIIEPNNSYREYIATPAGLSTAKPILQQIDENSLLYVRQVIEWVSRLTIMDIAVGIWNAYPETKTPLRLKE